MSFAPGTPTTDTPVSGADTLPFLSRMRSRPGSRSVRMMLPLGRNARLHGTSRLLMSVVTLKGARLAIRRARLFGETPAMLSGFSVGRVSIGLPLVFRDPRHLRRKGDGYEREAQQQTQIPFHAKSPIFFALYDGRSADRPAALRARHFLLGNAAFHGAAARREDAASGARRQPRGLEHVHGLFSGRAAARISLRTRIEHVCAAAVAAAGAHRRDDRRGRDAADADGDRRAAGRRSTMVAASRIGESPSACRSSPCRPRPRSCSSGFRTRTIRKPKTRTFCTPRATPEVCSDCSDISSSSRPPRGVFR